ncbi:MAG: hypothetical protein HYT15_04355 [Candidatus Magasanikbacteria bacterium]|nr:hypothetical protein [Candidatus Magasanikbacteria bacterium]
MPDKPRFPGPDDEIIGERIGPAEADDMPVGDASIFTSRIDLDEDDNNINGDLGESEYARSMREKSEREARRLLGLNVEWQPFTAAEQGAQLGSAERVASYRNIDTTTNPPSAKIREKQGIVAEIVRQELLSQELLRTLPTVYLGSGTDVEYPIALGARKIDLVDPIFSHPEAIKILEERLKQIVRTEVKLNTEDVTDISFDFGSGPETLSITIVPKVYYQEGMSFNKPDETYVFPDKAGLVILFASQGPGGEIRRDKEIERHIVEGGAILGERTLLKYPKGPQGEAEVIKLGKEID